MSSLKIDDQLELQPIQKHHAPAFFALIERNRAYLREQLGWLDGMQTISDAERYIDSRLALMAEENGYCFLLLAANKIAGVVHLVEVDRFNRKAMIGYWIGEEFRGNEFAKKATRAVTSYAFKNLGLHRIEIRCATDNKASQAIPRALGFKEEGVLRDNERLYDRFVDQVVFSLLKNEWAN